MKNDYRHKICDYPVDRLENPFAAVVLVRPPRDNRMRGVPPRAVLLTPAAEHRFLVGSDVWSVAVDIVDRDRRRSPGKIAGPKRRYWISNSAKSARLSTPSVLDVENIPASWTAAADSTVVEPTSSQFSPSVL